MKDYRDLRSQLLQMLEELDDRLGKIADEDTPGAMAESAGPRPTETCRPEEFSIEEAARSEIAKIKQAIGNMDKHTYGICLQCGRPINKARLATAPFTLHCEFCATTSNKSRRKD